MIDRQRLAGNDDAAVTGEIERQRLERLRSTMIASETPWLLTADPINIFYATGLRNMTVFSMMGAT